MPFIKITLSDLKPENFQLLLAELSDTPFNGIEENDDAYSVYYDINDWDESYESMMNKFTASIAKEMIADQNWNAMWESQFEPVIIDSFCYVKAPFHPEKEGFDHVIHLSPKMSFGTGHHATTRQMMKMMRQTDFKNKKVFDFGTGTGILAVLARKLEAEYVLANDNDSWSIDNARETVEKNNVSRIRIVDTDITGIHDKFDIILANINRHILLRHMPDMKRLLAENGQLILSGIFEVDRDLVAKAAEENGLKLSGQSGENNWACLLFTEEGHS